MFTSRLAAPWGWELCLLLVSSQLPCWLPSHKHSVSAIQEVNTVRTKNEFLDGRVDSGMYCQILGESCIAEILWKKVVTTMHRMWKWSALCFPESINYFLHKKRAEKEARDFPSSSWVLWNRVKIVRIGCLFLSVSLCFLFLCQNLIYFTSFSFLSFLFIKLQLIYHVVLNFANFSWPYLISLRSHSFCKIIIIICIHIALVLFKAFSYTLSLCSEFEKKHYEAVKVVLVPFFRWGICGVEYVVTVMITLQCVTEPKLEVNPLVQYHSKSQNSAMEVC